MKLKLLFLGRLEDVAGTAEREVVGATTLASVLAMLEPALAEALAMPRIRIAHNGMLVADPLLLALAEGDELAFLPPVSGG